MALRRLDGRRRGDDAPPRARVTRLFLRSLGVVAAIAFLSLAVQVPVLLGSHGLLPARELLETPAIDRAVAGHVPSVGLDGVAATRHLSLDRFLERPTLFWLSSSDATLEAAAWAGVAVSVLLALGRAPRFCLVAIWALYLSFVSVGQSFFAFQWDNLLLEAAAFALAVAPPGWKPRRDWAPGPVGVFLVVWLVFRLHFESGVVKLACGDPTWRDLTAMQSYYETAPIPTPLGWWLHQLPLGAQRLTSAAVLVAELAVPGLLLLPLRQARAAAFAVLVSLQVGIELTANYGFFNLLTIVLCIPILDDAQINLLWAPLAQFLNSIEIKKKTPQSAPPPTPRGESRVRTALLLAASAVLIPLTVLPLLDVVPIRGGPWLPPALRPFRTINAYHLFASMTLVRREVVLEGSDDGETWQSYELRWKPGDPERAPPFVAPHQPRVDFLAWFLLLGHDDAAWFQTLVKRVATEPGTVAPLFSRMPFDGATPRFLRVSTWRYRFTERAPGARTDAWWSRELIGHGEPIETSRFHRAPR